jgi:hypothetical protein
VIPLGGTAKLNIKLPSGWRQYRSVIHGALNTTCGSIPFIGVVSMTKEASGKVESRVELLTIPRIMATAGKAGSAIMRKQFRNFYREVEKNPKTSMAAWKKALALDCAAVCKDPSFMGSVEVRSQEDWKALKKAERLIRNVNELDYLLANRYMAEGWNKLRMAEVGKICGRILKRKPFPATTIKDRTTALDLQTTLKPGAQPKISSLKAVEKYRYKNK